MCMQHEAPIECVLSLPTGSAVLSGGSESQLKIWDIIAGGKLRHKLYNHQKAVTCLSLNGDGTRLLSGSLDHHVKVYAMDDWSVVHSIKYNAPVLSVAISVCYIIYI